MVKLFGDFYVVSGDKLTHPWDASAYLIAGDEPVLIDCGSSEGYPALKNNLKQLGYEPRDIRKVIVTHGHWDHMSGMALLRQESDAQLYMHEAEKEVVETGDYDRTSAFLYNKPFLPVKVDGLLNDGEVLQIGKHRLHVYHTPGHTPGGLTFLLELDTLKILIGGDTLWGGYHERVRSNLEDWKISINRLLELDFDVATIGHCPPTLIFDAKIKIKEAAQQLGVYLNPWFKPFYINFKY